MNTAAELMFGTSAQRSADQQLSFLAIGMNELQDLVERAASQQNGFSQEIRLSMPDRDDAGLHAICRVTPLRNDEGGEAESLLVAELLDATHWRQIYREQELIEQHDVSRRMISQLAHEIRNPLGGLRGAAQLLQRQLTTEDLREYTEVIIGEADRLATLVDGLLGPTGRARRTITNVHVVTERVLKLIESESHAGLVVNRDYDPSLPDVSMDSDQMIQAILNIATNAVQAMKEKGYLTIRTRALRNCTIGSARYKLVVAIEIEDDGPGVPEEIAASIFYPLVTGREGGTGLGLSLSQDLVSKHGGLIEYQSQAGRTVFAVRIPVEVTNESVVAG